MKTQLFFAVKNSPIAFKVCPHKQDPEQLVIKTKHPEVGAIVAQVAGAEILETEKGSHYFLTFVPKAAFLAGFGKLATDLAEGNVAVLPPKALQDVQIGPAVPVVDHLGDLENELDDDDTEF